MRCAVYLRVSTEDQAERETPIESQKPAILEWAERNEARILPDWIVEDRGWSGSTAERPGFKRILDAARNHPPFDTLLIYSYDRLFRNNRKFNRYVDELEDDCEVRVISVTESDEPDLLTDIRSVINEEARRAIIKHTMRAMKEIALRGHSCGGTPPYGYRRKELVSRSANRPVVWEIDPEKARIVKRLFKLYGSGMSYRKLAVLFNDEGIPSPGVGTARKRRDTGWATAGIRVMLHNETYRGWRIYNKTRKICNKPSKAINRPREQWIIVKNAHPKLIDDDLWEAVEKRYGAMREAYGSAGQNRIRGKYPLTGLLRCGGCGANFVIVHGHKAGQIYYGCAYARDRGPKVCKNTLTIEKGRIESWVYGILQAEILKPEIYELVCKAVEEELEMMFSRHKEGDTKILRDRISKELSQIECELLGLVAALKLGGQENLESVVKEIKRLEARKKTLEAEKASLSVVPVRPLKVSRETIDRHVHQLVHVLKNANPQELREFLREHIDRVVIQPNGQRRLYPAPNGLLHKALTAVSGQRHRKMGYAGSGIDPILRSSVLEWRLTEILKPHQSA